ncbi:NAD-binding protein [Cupriavidus oxalaticus]|uniref:NAD-binding protein n=1 Tax=Cupriavidus oxalaticus TaxID=96344 RepID=UPI001F0ED1AC|nr:NAD-binding protein [Cupriavidus oxalaticus]
MLVAISGTMVVAGYALRQLTAMLSGDDVMINWENKVMERTLETLGNHVAVCPFGAVGQMVAARLRDAGSTVLVLDPDAKQADKASRLGYMVMLGDQNSFDDVLERARLDNAHALFLTGSDPTSNLEITLVAHTLSPDLKIVGIRRERFAQDVAAKGRRVDRDRPERHRRARHGCADRCPPRGATQMKPGDCSAI